MELNLDAYVEPSAPGASASGAVVIVPAFGFIEVRLAPGPGRL